MLFFFQKVCARDFPQKPIRTSNFKFTERQNMRHTSSNPQLLITALTKLILQTTLNDNFDKNSRAQ